VNPFRQQREGSWEADSAPREIGSRSRLNRRANAPAPLALRAASANGSRRIGATRATLEGRSRVPVRGIAAASGNVSSARFHFFAVIRTLRVATAVVMGRAAHFRTRDVKRRPFLTREAGEPIELHPILGVGRLSDREGWAARRAPRRFPSSRPEAQATPRARPRLVALSDMTRRGL
jgi:hypothetical protein